MADSNQVILRIKSNPLLALSIFAVVALLAVIVFSGAKLLKYNETEQRYLQLASELRASSFRLASLSRSATSGEDSAYSDLQQTVDAMDRDWQELRSSDDNTRIALADELAAFEGVWASVKDNSQVILDNKETILFLHDVASTLNAKLPELQAEHNNIVEILLETNAPADLVSVAQMQSWRAERIGRNVDKMLRGGDDADKAADQFNLDASIFGKVLGGMREGDFAMGISRVTNADALSSLDDIDGLFEFVSGQVREIFEASPALFAARRATNQILDDGPQVLQSLNALSQGIDSLPTAKNLNLILIISGVLLLVFASLIGFLAYRSTNIRLQNTARTNERNQNAILRLLDELGDLADGDLTTTATVTEDFTGAIADSINYTIDQLRVLVSRINQTSEKVAAASKQTQQTALHLAEASEHQAQEIAGASAAVNEMAVTIDQVSANASESAGVAERSVSIAKNGAKVVQNTIDGMDTIREQIQETSKRIKRLGESSQEIGDIVSLINDIADQTNILALNAAIQASMAGEAGRGFAVVADEVQRLAERSATATKQIEGLVKTIQNDTNEAVISMEQTTSEVVRGARLAQDAGVALEEIETVSANLADLIQNISNAARQQASSAGHISNTMNVIQEITSQTSSGTGATAQAIGNLSGMALELRDSVAGFKLPEDLTSSANDFDGDGMDETIEMSAITDADLAEERSRDTLVEDYADDAYGEDTDESLELDDIPVLDVVEEPKADAKAKA